MLAAKPNTIYNIVVGSFSYIRLFYGVRHLNNETGHFIIYFLILSEQPLFVSSTYPL